MSVRFATSFDLLQSSDLASYLASFSSSQSGACTTSYAIGSSYSRWSSGQGLQTRVGNGPNGGAGTAWALNFNAQATWLFGFAVKPTTLGGTNILAYWALRDNGNLVIEVRMTNAGNLQVTRNGTVLGTSAQSLSSSAFSYVEFKVVLHASAGSYDLRVNGTTWLSGSGVNTTGTGTAQASQFYTYMNTNGIGSGAIEWYLDDLYICDGQTGLSDFLGDCHPIEILPDANGNYSQWSQTGGTGGSPYTAVNETPHNSDTSYLSSSTVGQRTTLNYPTVSTAGDIKAVIWAPWVRKDDANTYTVKCRTYESSTESTSSASITPASTYGVQQVVMETDPLDGAAWTAAKVNATEFGPVLV